MRKLKTRRCQLEQLEPRWQLAANLAIQGAELVTSGGTPLASVVYGEEVFIRARWLSTDLTAAQSYTLRITVDGIPLDTTVAGQSGVNVAVSKISGGWFAGPGSHTVAVALDATDAIVESSNADNSTTFNFAPVAPTTLPQKLIWPLPTPRNQDWSVFNYVDVDPRPDQRADFAGGTFQYEGHDAFDIVIGDFRQMDLGVPVYAAAAGTISWVTDGYYDRERTNDTSRTGNGLSISHGSGWSTLYYHFSENTITVKPGDVVQAGQLLGFVGSSGNSSAAHLHFSLSRGGAVVETMYAPNDYFVIAPVYQPNTAPDLFALGITSFDNFANDRAEAVNSVTQFPAGYSGNVYTWFTASHFFTGDAVEVRWYRPDSSLLATSSFNPTGRGGGTYYFFRQTSWTNGTWQAAVVVNGMEKGRTSFVIGAATPQAEIRLLEGTNYILDERTTPVDFGSVAVAGSAISKTFTVENRGFSALTLSNLVLPDGFSLVGSLPSSVAPAGSATFTVRLDSVRAGRKFGEARFLTNDPDEATFTFNLEGNVVGTLATGTPVLTFPGAQLAYHLTAAPKPLDVGATITDSNSSNFSGGTLVATIVSGGSGSDRLTVRHEGTGVGQIGVSGASVSFGGTTIGTLSGGTNSQPLNIALNANATIAATQALLRSVAFANDNAADVRHARYVGVTLTDNTALKSLTAYRTVLPVYDPPTISNISDQNIASGGNTGDLPFSVGDVEQALGITVTATSSNPAFLPVGNIVLSGSGTSRAVRATGAVGQTGSSLVTLTASDPNGGTAIETFTVAVANSPPTISDIAPQTINEDGTTGALAFAIGDDHTAAGTLTLSAASTNSALVPASNMVFGGSGANRTVTVTPLANQFGQATITISVNDGVNTTAKAFLLTVNSVNDPPTISAINNQSVNEDSVLGPLTFTVGDVDTALSALILSAASTNPALIPVGNVVFGGSGANRTVTITPAANQSGTTTITITVGDGEGGSVNRVFQVTVNAINDAPTIVPIGPQRIDEDQATGLIPLTIDDVETVASTLQISASSSNSTLTPSGSFALGGSGGNRTLRITPAPNQFGTATITVTVSDGAATAQQQFTLTVDPVNDLPTITPIADQTTNEDVAINGLAFTVGDLETPAGSLQVSAVSDDPLLLPVVGLQIQGTGANRTLRIVPTQDRYGAARVFVTVFDGQASVVAEFVVTILPVNDAPSALFLSSTSVLGQAYGAIVGDLSALDPDSGDTHSFTTADPRFEIVGQRLKLKPDQWLDPTLGITNVEVIAHDSHVPSASRTELKTLTILANATPWRNARLRLDVDDDGLVTPLDALLIVNELNASGARVLKFADFTLPPRYFDTSGDNTLNPLDAVLVINALNAGTNGEATSPDVDHARATDALLADDQLDWDFAWWTWDDLTRSARRRGN